MTRERSAIKISLYLAGMICLPLMPIAMNNALDDLHAKSDTTQLDAQTILTQAQLKHDNSQALATNALAASYKTLGLENQAAEAFNKAHEITVTLKGDYKDHLVSMITSPDISGTTSHNAITKLHYAGMSPSHLVPELGYNFRSTRFYDHCKSELSNNGATSLTPTFETAKEITHCVNEKVDKKVYQPFYVGLMAGYVGMGAGAFSAFAFAVSLISSNLRPSSQTSKKKKQTAKPKQS